MGQPIVVTEKRSVTNPDVVRFEMNRALTGMGHERYTSADVFGERPPDVLARRLFALGGGIETVHINGNIVTVDLSEGADTAGMLDVIETLYTFYELSPETEAAAEAAPEPPVEGSEAADPESSTVAPVDDTQAAEPAAAEPVTEPGGPTAS